MKHKKGFTLIELLIVIAIIGLLASVVLVGLTNARKAGRDARRVADLKTIQNALELYYNRCGYYPGPIPAGTSGCGTFTQQSFSQMETVLTSSNIGVGQVPNDPAAGATYEYAVETPGGQQYVLGATLEDENNRAFINDLDGSYSASGGNLDCTDASPNLKYCVGIASGNF